MAELRFNPFIDDYVMIASHRQDRPQMPKNWCPFCPGPDNKKLPENYTVLKYDNDFPALSPNPPEMFEIPEGLNGDLYKCEPSYGKCEVILYSPEHTASLHELSVPHITELVQLWQQRFAELSADEKHKYIFIFENRGEVVGVTMPHPHGQLYAYPFIPKRMELETECFKKYSDKHNSCLLCDTNASELSQKVRVIAENEHFVCYIPFFCEYPYGTYIAPKAHKQNITQLDASEANSLAIILKEITAAYDALFGKPFPYMMCMYQNPVNCGDFGYYHWHIKFFPPMRSAEKQKFNASSETGVWAHCNPTAPESCAEELRQAYSQSRFIP